MFFSCNEINSLKQSVERNNVSNGFFPLLKQRLSRFSETVNRPQQIAFPFQHFKKRKTQKNGRNEKEKWNAICSNAFIWNMYGNKTKSKSMTHHGFCTPHFIFLVIFSNIFVKVTRAGLRAQSLLAKIWQKNFK